MTISDTSSWRDAAQPPPFPSLSTSVNADIAIVGGGITGITAAYFLRRSGKSVALIEKGRLGQYASGSTTGFLMETLDTNATELIEQFGLEKTMDMFAAQRGAITAIEKIIREENIECEFMRCPAYIFATSQKDADALQTETGALRKVGTEVSFHTDDALPIKNFGYMQIANQAKFHSLKYIFALAEACRAAGVHLYEHTEALSITEEVQGGPGGSAVQTNTGSVISSSDLLMATHYPLDPQPAKLKFKKAWYTTYVLETWIPSGILPEALYEDTELPYHYARVDAKDGRDRLIIGGEDHRSDVSVDEEKSFASLEEYTKKLLAGVDFEITRRWKGSIVESGDGLAFIGPIGTSRIFYATGFSGTGLTYATISANAFAKQVLGKKDSRSALYAADRPFSLQKSLPKAIEYVEEFVLGAVKTILSPKQTGVSGR